MDNKGIFDYFLYVLPFINDMSNNDVGVSLTDREKYLLYKPGRTLDLKVNAGDPVKPGSTVYRAMTDRRRIIQKVDRAMFGLPCIAVAIPLFNANGDVIGAASMQETLERQETIKDIAATVQENVEVLASTSEQIAAQAEEIAAMSTTMVGVTTESLKRVRETDDILHLIRNVANQTNLLGLNAAIEAARVGAEGRGFGVVADEIRKLSAESTASINRITAIIQAIQADAGYTVDQTKSLGQAIGQVSESIVHIANAIQESNNMAKRLDTLADELVGTSS